jgi:S-DNA-T family DNA segregation ATPase FtsK/SpoIIIE
MSGAPRVRANKYLDQVLVHMLAGQAEKHYEDRADELARAFGARRCAVRVHKSGQVWLDFYHADALAETIPALPIPRKPDPAAVVVGRIEAG